MASPEVLARIDALPDEALVEVRKSDNGLWYGQLRNKQKYAGDADFGDGGKTREEAIKFVAKRVRNDLRGVGKYAPHFELYDLEYRFLPYWEEAVRKGAAKGRTMARGIGNTLIWETRDKKHKVILTEGGQIMVELEDGWTDWPVRQRAGASRTHVFVYDAPERIPAEMKQAMSAIFRRVAKVKAERLVVSANRAAGEDRGKYGCAAGRSPNRSDAWYRGHEEGLRMTFTKQSAKTHLANLPRVPKGMAEYYKEYDRGYRAAIRARADGRAAGRASRRDYSAAPRDFKGVGEALRASARERQGRGMTLAQIKAAVDAGKTVHWANDGYKVIKDRLGQYLIVFTANDHAIGLTWADGRTMNGKPEEFFLAGKPLPPTISEVGGARGRSGRATGRRKGRAAGARGDDQVLDLIRRSRTQSRNIDAARVLRTGDKVVVISGSKGLQLTMGMPLTILKVEPMGAAYSHQVKVVVHNPQHSIRRALYAVHANRLADEHVALLGSVSGQRIVVRRA